MTTIFFPAFNAMKGFGLRTGVGCSIVWRGKAHENNLRNTDDSGVGGVTGVIDVDDSGTESWRRCRGNGGGSSGNTSNKSVNS